FQRGADADKAHGVCFIIKNMAAYLIVDIDDLLKRFGERSMAIDLQELAVGLRGAAALAAGLVSADNLKAIAVANWSNYDQAGTVDPQYIFKVSGYEVFDVPHRATLADVLMIHYFSYDPEPVNELILATTSRDLLPLIKRIRVTRNARIRMWGSEDVLQGTEFVDDIIFQPLESLLGIQSKNVSVYIDFENISISLNEQGYMVNLDHLIERFVAQARAHGQIVRMAAYAPWGQRGTLPPLVDRAGREIADDAPSRLMLANIDPVFNLPGKNSADMRIARDVITDSSNANASDVYILATGDRDFNEVINTLVQRGKVVILWGVQGSTSRQLENHPSVTMEYVEDFTSLTSHRSLSDVAPIDDEAETFIPSQWSSVVVQYDRAVEKRGSHSITQPEMIQQLQQAGAVASRERGADLVNQALAMGILQNVEHNGTVIANAIHPIVDKTRAIKNAVSRRVANTLKVRNWGYVNYGFLLKGLEMERDLMRPGMNEDDQWRSHWIDSLVRERVLKRDLIPHRHNPDDLVPVISLPDDAEIAPIIATEALSEQAIAEVDKIDSPEQLGEIDQDAASMSVRVIVSVEQFTSFRSFAWCPLGSLHRRLRPYDTGMSFQRAVEFLQSKTVVKVDEYPNPQSDY
ncbi:MAG: NYN domain-containing protein, partial [Aggregatilineales bacterium]